MSPSEEFFFFLFYVFLLLKFRKHKKMFDKFNGWKITWHAIYYVHLVFLLHEFCYFNWFFKRETERGFFFFFFYFCGRDTTARAQSANLFPLRAYPIQRFSDNNKYGEAVEKKSPHCTPCWKNYSAVVGGYLIS